MGMFKAEVAGSSRATASEALAGPEQKSCFHDLFRRKGISTNMKQILLRNH